ncbi:MAG: hypothetical protein NTZ80_04030 [Patescibacteria group bacterium]|nr:hypothetical protein [Patescibacteria group bacterium]
MPPEKNAITGRPNEGAKSPKEIVCIEMDKMANAFFEIQRIYNLYVFTDFKNLNDFMPMELVRNTTALINSVSTIKHALDPINIVRIGLRTPLEEEAVVRKREDGEPKPQVGLIYDPELEWLRAPITGTEEMKGLEQLAELLKKYNAIIGLPAPIPGKKDEMRETFRLMNERVKEIHAQSKGMYIENVALDNIYQIRELLVYTKKAYDDEVEKAHLSQINPKTNIDAVKSDIGKLNEEILTLEMLIGKAKEGAGAVSMEASSIRQSMYSFKTRMLDLQTILEIHSYEIDSYVEQSRIKRELGDIQPPK